MTHTPGPWRATEPADGDEWEIMDGFGTIATVYGEGQEAADTARLIAAAPEMLTALLAAKDELISLYEYAYPGDESDNHTTAVIDKVIAVINKARGTEVTT